MQKNYETLTDEQQIIVNNLILSLVNLNTKTIKSPEKRTFGKFEEKAKIVFQILGK